MAYPSGGPCGSPQAPVFDGFSGLTVLEALTSLETAGIRAAPDPSPFLEFGDPLLGFDESYESCDGAWDQFMEVNRMSHNELTRASSGFSISEGTEGFTDGVPVPPASEPAATSSSSYTSRKANGVSVDGERRKRRRVTYPFAVVKPGGAEGEETLEDINHRLLVPPTRPVRHPVGDFACPPGAANGRRALRQSGGGPYQNPHPRQQQHHHFQN